MEEKKGSSGCQVLIGETVEKKGNRDALKLELDAYLRLENILGEKSNVLPKILGFVEDENKAVLKLERLPGNVDLEQYILIVFDEAEKIENIRIMIGNVLEMLDDWLAIKSTDDPEILLCEIGQALNVAWEKYVRLGGDQNLFDSVALKSFVTDKKIREFLLTGVSLGPCHRDLCTNNIWPLSDNSVQVFDPRWQLTGSSVTSIGHVVLDLASFRINLERLQADRFKNGLSLLIPIDIVDSKIDEWIRQKHFVRELYDLVLLRRYIAFAACRCEHCIHPSRLHRFELMEKQAAIVGNKLINIFARRS